MAVAIAVDMDAGAMAGAMAAEKMAARKPNPATNGLGSDGIDGLQRWGDVPPTAVEADLSEVFLLDDMVTSPFVMNEELHILW